MYGNHSGVGFDSLFWFGKLAVSALALLTYVCLAVLIPIQFVKALEPLLSQQNASRKQYVSYFIESLKSVKDLLQFQQTDQRFSALNSKSQLVNQQEREVAKANFMQYALSFLVVGLSILGFAYIIFDLVATGRLDLADGTGLLVAFTSSFAPFLELS